MQLIRKLLLKELENVTATDKEDGDLTSKIKVTNNTVDTSKIGTYEVTYEVEDSKQHKTIKTITVEVTDAYIKEPGEFYLESLDFDKTKKVYTISGYLTILNQDNINIIHLKNKIF